jgi:hypothetical protein
MMLRLIGGIDYRSKTVDFSLKEVFFYISIHMFHDLFIHLVSRIILQELVFKEIFFVLIFIEQNTFPLITQRKLP